MNVAPQPQVTIQPPDEDHNVEVFDRSNSLVYFLCGNNQWSQTWLVGTLWFDQPDKRGAGRSQPTTNLVKPTGKQAQQTSETTITVVVRVSCGGNRPWEDLLSER